MPFVIINISYVDSAHHLGNGGVFDKYDKGLHTDPIFIDIIFYQIYNN
jgi:hypothetical protein